MKGALLKPTNLAIQRSPTPFETGSMQQCILLSVDFKQSLLKCFDTFCVQFILTPDFEPTVGSLCRRISIHYRGQLPPCGYATDRDKAIIID